MPYNLEIFEPSNVLRWLDTGETKVLQQAWVGDRTGNINWRSVPTVSTTKESR